MASIGRQVREKGLEGAPVADVDAMRGQTE